MTLEEMLAMKLNEIKRVARDDDAWIRRVPGGWIYTEGNSTDNISACFVPEPPKVKTDETNF